MVGLSRRTRRRRRKPLASDLAAGTVVLWEHIIPIVVLAPFLPSALRAFARLTRRDQAAVVLIGIGSSAVATALFTRAFAIAGADGDYITPLVLQKLQPVLAIALAVLVLGERLRPHFGLYVLPVLVGAWLLAFADPMQVRVSELEPALLRAGVGHPPEWVAVGRPGRHRRHGHRHGSA
ncbi:EamA family transporter [Williamsia sp. CHRR-6]|uniref:EamA family transporter n=1 Tax=Williamsia sp. CHRR-6 TaxID=2835871 RepID=UPI001BD9275A|nr:EamA family transporter [Williamsia sp. CHRR-6]MBT0565800.1 EamA family transporter [Williamsia sp. CHRR-6]